MCGAPRVSGQPLCELALPGPLGPALHRRSLARPGGSMSGFDGSPPQAGTMPDLRPPPVCPGSLGWRRRGAGLGRVPRGTGKACCAFGER